MPKNKKSKKQKQKLLELQKQQQEELEKQKAEQEERIRIQNEEKEKIRKQEKQIFKQQEYERLQIEKNNYSHKNLDLKKNQSRALNDYQKKIEWKYYINCKEEFNIQKESDLNLLICFLEEKEINSYNDLEQLLDMIEQSQQTITQIQEKILKISGEDNNEVIKLQQFSNKIIEINKNKIEQACNFIIQDSENIVNENLKKMQETNGQNQKLIDQKPEIQIDFIRKKLKLALWIMGFENNGIKPKPIEFLNLDVMSDIPKAFFNKSLILIVKQYPSYYINNNKIQDENKNLRLIFQINDIACYAYPDQSKKLGKYTMKKIFDRKEQMQKLTYQYYDNSSNFKVYIHIPEQIIILPSDKLEFMYWSEQKQIWTKENTKAVELEYSKEQRKYFYSVSIPQMAPVGVFTNKWAEFPYQYFQIRRIGQRTIKFCLETLRNTLSFLITPGQVELESCQNKQLNNLKNQQFSPQQLLVELAEKNVFLTPQVENEENFGDLMIKNSNVENFVLQELSKTCLYYHFQLSIWNQRTKRNSLILKLRENPEFDENFHENTEIDWSLVMFKDQKCQVLKILENSEQFSKELKNDTQSHINLYYLFQQYPQYFQSQYYHENFTDEEFVLIQTIQNFLKPMHLFMFSC